MNVSPAGMHVFHINSIVTITVIDNNPPNITTP